MSVYSPKYKVCRRLLCNLWGREKDPVNFKNYRNGQHGQKGSRIRTQYCVQLEEKQKLRSYYCMREKQFETLIEKAKSALGETGENIINSLESRVATLVYRAGFASTMFHARQLVSHGHILLNGKKITIGSAKVPIGWVVSLSESAALIPVVAAAISSSTRRIPGYLSLSEDRKSVTFARKATFPEVPYECNIDLRLVVEYYSH